MSKENITIHEIAKMLEISPSTVSRALNDHPRISPKTRSTVKEMALKQGYLPNTLARSLRKGKTKTVGIVVPRINRYFFSNVISGLQEELNKSGYNVTICQTLEEHEKEIESIHTLLNLRVDAIFISLSTGTRDTSHLEELRTRGIEIYMFDRTDRNLSQVNQVILNDYKGAFDTVSHMIDMGYREIWHFAGPAHLSVYRERKQGYLDALEKNRIPNRDEWIIPDTLTREKGFKIMRNLLDSGKKPDGIFSASDFSALGALLAAKDAGIDIPGEMGVAGFANEPFTELINPPLTTTDQDPHSMSRLLAEVFLKRRKKDPPAVYKIEPRLIIRQSTLKKSITQ